MICAHCAPRSFNMFHLSYRNHFWRCIEFTFILVWLLCFGSKLKPRFSIISIQAFRNIQTKLFVWRKLTLVAKWLGFFFIYLTELNSWLIYNNHNRKKNIYMQTKIHYQISYSPWLADEFLSDGFLIKMHSLLSNNRSKIANTIFLSKTIDDEINNVTNLFWWTRWKKMNDQYHCEYSKWYGYCIKPL